MGILPAPHTASNSLCVQRGGGSSLRALPPDGTCIRNYIHVCDLAEAHVLAAEAIEPGAVKVFNLGNGEGFSVKQVIDICRAVSGDPIPSEIAPRRPAASGGLIRSGRS